MIFPKARKSPIQYRLPPSLGNHAAHHSWDSALESALICDISRQAELAGWNYTTALTQTLYRLIADIDQPTAERGETFQKRIDYLVRLSNEALKKPAQNPLIRQFSIRLYHGETPRQTVLHPITLHLGPGPRAKTAATFSTRTEQIPASKNALWRYQQTLQSPITRSEWQLLLTANPKLQPKDRALAETIHGHLTLCKQPDMPKTTLKRHLDAWDRSGHTESLLNVLLEVRFSHE
jgi:hypothetical protein